MVRIEHVFEIITHTLLTVVVLLFIAIPVIGSCFCGFGAGNLVCKDLGWSGDAGMGVGIVTAVVHAFLSFKVMEWLFV